MADQIGEEVQELQEAQSAREQARYVVHLPIFEGPLDLLLHLIEKRQMEITTISLVAVTDQYMEYLARWEEEKLPLANMAAFVSIAARLLFIKSQSLLPQTPREAEHAETSEAAAMAEELQQHLLEYKVVKDIAQLLKQREDEGLQTYARSGLLAGIEAQLAWTPPTLTGLEVQALARAFQRILELQARDEAQGDQLLPVARVRVSERIAVITEYLREREPVSLAEVLAGEQSRFVIVVTFIAVLEMWKWQRVEVTQEELLGPILLSRGARWNAQEQDQIED
ncbi:condensin subunit ScpA [Thermosporothrix hazakensis]|jgi:segregation and condensation protein A|uniref:Segregation and condensation protein A n=2 Tax=Thermosporothrix TaxID=768650 RepID=A0A326U2A5_THEHA|nr:segregation/condensation protein A [Thermosporothrix hazakensis]PZW24187.1 condensin subunit ScpA [Thermosporothrix hazakensis]BBH89633.1 segregation/condensation protein A [Thermosporothrix sp. COM3]GCE47819.1 segregation/condensation protein A [Thermosporothrix hazakensis]